MPTYPLDNGLSVAEIDANLFALGVGSDARGLRVMIVGHQGSPLSDSIESRLVLFGATVLWAHDSVADPDMQVDYLVALPSENSMWNVAKLVENVLRPSGRYMVLLDQVGDERAKVTITDVQVLGVSAVRVLGYKARNDVGSESDQ